MKVFFILRYILSVDRYVKNIILMGFLGSSLEVFSGVLIAATLGKTMSFLVSAGTESTDFYYTLFGHAITFDFATLLVLGGGCLLFSTCVNGFIQLKLNECAARIGALFASSIIVSWLSNVPRDLSDVQLNESEIQKKAVSDSQRLTVAVIQPLLTAMPKVFLILLCAAAISVVFPESLVVLGLIGLTLSVPLMGLRRLIKRNGAALTRYDVERFGALRATLDLADEIIVYGLHEKILLRLKDKLDSHAVTYGRGVGLSSLPRYIVELVVFGVALVGAAFVVLGDVSLLEKDASKVALVLVIILKVVPAMQVVLTSVARINGSSQLFLDLSEEAPIGKYAKRKSLQVSSLSEQALMTDVESISANGLTVSLVSNKITYPDFTAYQHEMTVIKGRSGSGKTTLTRAILGLVESTGGVDFGIHDGRSYQRIGYCSQTPPAFSGTVASNLLLGPDAALALNDELSLAAKEMLMLPFGYQVSEGGRNLSGGQRVRMGIARAVLSGRPVLIFDEPTNGQDAETVEKIINVLQIAKAGRVVMVVSHDPRLITIADNVVDLDH